MTTTPVSENSDDIGKYGYKQELHRSLSFRDLLILGASVFFEADQPRNLWRVDEFLTLRFLPLCHRLGLGE